MNITAYIECDTIIPESPTLDTTDKDAEDRIRRMQEEFEKLSGIMDQTQSDKLTPSSFEYPISAKMPSKNKVSVNAQLFDKNGNDMSVDDILNAIEGYPGKGYPGYVTIDIGDDEDVMYEFSVWSSECEKLRKLQEKVSESGGNIDFSHKIRKDIEFTFKNRVGVDRWAQLNLCMIYKKISDCRYVLEITGISFVKK